jgi:DNA-binding transcriptional ArsR family regulator
MNQEKEEVLTKLDEISKSIESFNESLIRVRYDDYKRALSEQIQSVFGDNSGTLFDSGLEMIRSSSSCQNKASCIEHMCDMREETMAAFGREDIMEAMMILEDTEGELACDRSPCRDEECSDRTIEMIHHIKVLFSISDNLMFRNYIQPETGFTRLSSKGRFFSEHRRSTEQELPSEEVSKMIGPLANPYRIEILKMVSQKEMGFTQISKSLGLKTGHLQFHLKALKDAGYVRSSRHRRSYSITAKGIAALEGLNKFFEGLTEKKRKPSAIKI